MTKSDVGPIAPLAEYSWFGEAWDRNQGPRASSPVRHLERASAANRVSNQTQAANAHSRAWKHRSE